VSGTSSKGFTLLEVVVALVIFAVSITVIINIQTNHITKIAENLEKVRALNYLKEYVYNIPVKESKKEFKIEEKKKPYEFDLNKITYQVIKGDKTIIELFEYELQKK